MRKIFIIDGLSQHCQILIFDLFNVLKFYLEYNSEIWVLVYMCVCVSLFFILVRQSKQCKWLYRFWDFKFFKVKNNKTNFTHLCVCKNFIIVRQSQYCHLLILIFILLNELGSPNNANDYIAFEILNASVSKKTRPILPTCVCVKYLSLLGSPNIVRYYFDILMC